MASALTVRVRIENVQHTLRRIRELGPEANNQLRDKSREIAERLAVQIRAEAAADSAQSALIGPTVKAKRDRVPVIQAGGKKRVGRNRAPAYKVLFGSEFGSNNLDQYRPHLGQGSYWFFRTVEDNQDEISREWNQVAEDIVRLFGS